MPSNSEIGQSMQEKYQFYLLGLIFTLLGLAVQTAKFGNAPVANAFELVAWGLLLISALLLMNRIEWAPQIYRLFDIQQEIEAQQRQLQTAITTGVPVVAINTQRPVDPQEFLRQLQEKLDLTKRTILKLDGGSVWKDRIHRICFLAGLILLLVARAYVPACNLLQRGCGEPSQEVQADVGMRR